MKLLRYFQRCNKMAVCVCLLLQAIYFIGDFIMVQSTSNIYANIGDNITATCQIEKVHVWTFLKTKEILALCRERNTINMRSNKAKRLNIGANCSLHIYKFKKEDVGKYKCSHPIKIYKSDIINIQLRIRPNVSIRVYINSVLQTKKQIFMVKKGDMLELICNEHSNGTIGTFRWTHNLQNLPKSTNTSLFEKVDRQINGKYVCTAENLAGDKDSDTVNISVEYPPLVKNKSHTFCIGEKPRILKCEASGVPNMYKFSEWRHLVNGNHVRFLVGHENGTLTLPCNSTNEIQYDDSGLYICNVTNYIRNENGQLWQTGTINVTIKDKPVLARPLNQVYIGRNISTTSVIFYLLSSSELSISNFNEGGVQTTKCAVTTVKTKFHGTPVNVSGYACNFSIPETKGGNFQNYSVTVSNECCSNIFNLSIRSAREPVKPNVLNFTASTTCIYVLFEPRSDGGLSQEFIIEYRKQLSRKWKWLLVKNVGTARIGYHISSLDPSTGYDFRIFARNVIGNSSSTKTYSVRTTDEKKSFKIGYTIVIIVTTVLTCCLIIICWRRQKTEKNVSHRSQIVEYSNQGGAIENSLYQSASDLTEPSSASGIVETANRSIDRRKTNVNGQIVGYNIVRKEDSTRLFDCKEINSREEKNISYDTSMLNYVEVAFDPAEISSKFYIHGADNRTPYADIDFSLTADPLTSSDEESVSPPEDNNDFLSLEDLQQWNIHES